MKTTKNENSTDIETFLNHRDIKLYKRIMDKIEKNWNTIDSSTLSDMVDILGLLNTNIQSHIQKLKNQELFQTSYRRNPKEGDKSITTLEKKGDDLDNISLSKIIPSKC